jgi:hypothetical protein
LDADTTVNPKKGTCLAKNSRNVAQNCSQLPGQDLSYQCKGFEVITLQDALVAYKTYARAEGKSPKTIAWIAYSMSYFAEFLSPE